MADFSAAGLLAAAKARYGETRLRQRIRGASDRVGKVDNTEADAELLLIAESVMTRAQVAIAASVGWPLPGTWPGGSQTYAEKWPADLLQRSLELLNWRTQVGLETPNIGSHERNIGQAAERYFDEVEQGAIGLGLIGVDTDVGMPTPIAARDREGNSLIATADDRSNVFAEMSGIGWDYL